MSGIFNVLMVALRRLLKHGCIFVREKTTEERREKHELAVNPIGYFVREAIAGESVESDATTKETLYQAYKSLCKERQLAVESKENFGRILKSKYGFKDGRESSGERRTGVKLVAS